MTKLKFLTISELPDVTQRIEGKEFEFYGRKFTVGIYAPAEKMQSLILSISDEEGSVHVASRGYISKVHIAKIWDIYNSQAFDLEKSSAPNAIKSLYGIGIPESFWQRAREKIWSISAISAMLEKELEISAFRPVYEDDLSNKIYNCLRADKTAMMSVVRNTKAMVDSYSGWLDINSVVHSTTSIIDLYIENVLIRFGKNEGAPHAARAEINALPHDFVIPTSIDKLFQVSDDKFKGFNDTGKGYSRSTPVRRDENGVSLDKVRIPKAKTSDELTHDEMVALSVLEKLYGSDVAKVMVKGRELISVTANEGNYTDEGGYFSAEVLVEIKIAK